MEVSERVDRGSLGWEGLGLGVQRKRNFRVPKRWGRDGPGLRASWSQTHSLRTKQTSGYPTPALPMTAVPSNIGPVGAGRGRGRAGKEDTRDQSPRHPRKRRVPPGAKRGTHRRMAGMEVKGGTEFRVEGALNLKRRAEEESDSANCIKVERALFWKEVTPTLLI